VDARSLEAVNIAEFLLAQGSRRMKPKGKSEHQKIQASQSQNGYGKIVGGKLAIQRFLQKFGKNGQGNFQS